VPSVKESIERVRKVQAPELARMHKALWGMSAAQLAVVGDFDAATVKAQLEKDLGAWNRLALTGGSRFTHSAPTRPPTKSSIPRTRKWPSSSWAAPCRCAMTMLRIPALTMLNYMLGGSPTSRLFDRLRQKEGLSYGAGSRIFAHPIDVNGISGLGICAPRTWTRAWRPCRRRSASW